MDIFDLTAGVAAGIIIAVIFLWCLRLMDRRDEENIPIAAILGVLLILAFLGSTFYVNSPSPLIQRGQSAAEYPQAGPASGLE